MAFLSTEQIPDMRHLGIDKFCCRLPGGEPADEPLSSDKNSPSLACGNLHSLSLPLARQLGILRSMRT